MKKCILPSNWIEIMNVVNMLAEHFGLNAKSIKVFENGNCSLDCTKKNKSSIDTINVSVFLLMAWLLQIFILVLIIKHWNLKIRYK